MYPHIRFLKQIRCSITNSIALKYVRNNFKTHKSYSFKTEHSDIQLRILLPEKENLCLFLICFPKWKLPHPISEREGKNTLCEQFIKAREDARRKAVSGKERCDSMT